MLCKQRKSKTSLDRGIKNEKLGPATELLCHVNKVLYYSVSKEHGKIVWTMGTWLGNHKMECTAESMHKELSH